MKVLIDTVIQLLTIWPVECKIVTLVSNKTSTAKMSCIWNAIVVTKVVQLRMFKDNVE